MKRCQDLEAVLGEIQTSVNIMLNEKQCENECSLTSSISELSDKLQSMAFEKDSSNVSLSSTATTVILNKPETTDVCVETELSYLDLQKQLEDQAKQNKDVREQCDNLSQALELLRNEFDSCENYWSSKLDEERISFEQEQKQSSEKLNELLVKISEYEEQFTQDGRLAPIDETDCLEKQYVDLDDEYMQYKSQMELEIQERDSKIIELQDKLDEYNKLTSDEAIQVTIHDSYDKINNLSNVIESSNIFSSETLPHLWNPPQIQSDSVDSSLVLNNTSERDYTNPAFVWNNDPSEPSTKSNSIINELQVPNEASSTCNSLPASISWQPPKDTSPQPHSLSVIPDNVSNTNTYRVKRSRKHDRNSFTGQYKPQKKEAGRQFVPRWGGGVFQENGQTCVVSISSIHHLHRRLYELDQHCRHLQFILKQEQQHSEALRHCKYYYYLFR